MNVNDMIKLVIGVVVGVLMLSAILVPVIGTATETNGTVTNDGLYTLTEYESTDELTVTWKYTAPNQLEIGSDVVTYPTQTSGDYPFTLMGNSDFIMRYFILNGVHYVQIWTSDNTTVYSARTADHTNMTITITGGTATFDNGSGTTRSVTLTESFYCLDADGEWTMKSTSSTAYVLEDTEILGLGTTPINKSNGTIDEWFVISGNINDGFTADYAPYEVSVGDITATYTESSNDYLVGLYDFNKLEFTVTYDSTDTDVTYSQIMVPTEVTGELSSHLTNDEITMFNTIPLLVTVGIIVGVVGVAFSRRE